MTQRLLEKKKRYTRMLDALAEGNPVDLQLRRDLEAAIASIDKAMAECVLGDSGADTQTG